MKKETDKSQKKSRVLRNNLYLLRQIHAASPGRIPLYLLLIIAKSTSNFLFDVYMLKVVINSLQTGADFRSILIFILSIAAYHLCVCFFENAFNELFVPRSDLKIHRYMQKKVFAKAAAVEIACFENPEFYDRYVKAVSEASGRAAQVLQSLGEIVGCVFTVSAMSFVIFTIDPLLILFALLPFAVSLLFGGKMNRLQYDYNMEMQEKSRKRDYVRRVFYLADYAKEIRLSQINKALMVKFTDAIRELRGVIRKYGWKVGLLDYLFTATNDIVVYLGAILYAAYKTLVSKTMLYGDCVVVINTINSVAWSLRGIVDIGLQFHSHALYIENLRFFLEYEPAIGDNPAGAAVPHQGVLRLEHVSFRYEGQEKPALKDISLTIRPGEKIALVGHNGAGKTTLIKLLMRLYDVSEGEILLDGRPIREYRLRDYRGLFGAVFQDYRIFSLSAMENVLLKDNITPEERERAAEGMKNSGIWEKVQSLPRKENTTLTREFDDDGAVLSGGEYQKIAVARVFARPCEIVILDEPSSALDPIAEYRMYEAMMNACRDKAVIFISHRLSSAVLADKVFLLEHGEIVEQGAHFDLLRQRGKYAELWEMQAEKYSMEARST